MESTASNFVSTTTRVRLLTTRQPSDVAGRWVSQPDPDVRRLRRADAAQPDDDRLLRHPRGRATRDTADLLVGTVFVGSAFVASASWQLLLASGGAILGRTLTSPQGRLITTLVGNDIIALLAIRLAWQAVG
jgi:hypothetical protein